MKYLLLLLILLTSLFIKSQDANFPYCKKDYLVTMNKVVNIIEDLYNSNGDDTTLTSKLMDLSSDTVYVLSVFSGMDQRYIAAFAIKEWFIPTINRLYTYSPIKVNVAEKDIDKWGVWFRVKVTDMHAINYIDFGINKENKLRSIIF